jgi:hypothetical protein
MIMNRCAENIVQKNLEIRPEWWADLFFVSRAVTPGFGQAGMRIKNFFG